MTKMGWLGFAGALALLIILTQVFTLFIIQPIGAIPDGVTVLIWRREKTQFIDSADAICAREFGGVSLFCRMGAMTGVVNGGEPILRLPYSSLLYLISTNGATYEK